MLTRACARGSNASKPALVSYPCPRARCPRIEHVPLPYHEGELAVQADLGVTQQAARLAPLFRDHLTAAQRAFFPLLPFAVVGSLSPEGQPAASLLCGPPGFITACQPTRLRFDVVPLAHDPLARHLRPGAPLGVLGI